MATKSPHFHARLRKHLKADPAELAVVETSFPPYHRANLQIALEAMLAEKGVRHDVEGIVLSQEYDSVTLSKLSRPRTARDFLPGPVEYAEAAVAGGNTLACVRRGIYWIRTPQARVALLVNEARHYYPPRFRVEVMAPTQDLAQDFSRALAARTNACPAFRGHVISLEMGCDREMTVQFHALPEIGRDQIVLPEAVLRRIDRHSTGFARHAETLRAAGRHLKRGILLHGPPGTGKTLSAMYLAGQLPGRTVLILTGGGMSSIESSGQLARALAPVTVILEDVDLIGTMREHQTVGANALLFELLNQMDGLAPDSDVLFVLTTNRPDVLEPALASRPGRIDQAIEIPLPDAECRRRLLALYGTGLNLSSTNLEEVVAKTEGASAAFMRELLRKAAILAAEQVVGENGQARTLAVSDAHLAEALNELLLANGPLTARLLGISPPAE